MQQAKQAAQEAQEAAERQFIGDILADENSDYDNEDSSLHNPSNGRSDIPAKSQEGANKSQKSEKGCLSSPKISEINTPFLNMLVAEESK